MDFTFKIQNYNIGKPRMTYNKRYDITYNKYYTLDTYSTVKAEIDKILYVVDRLYDMITCGVPKKSGYRLTTSKGMNNQYIHNFSVYPSDGYYQIVGFDSVGYNNIFCPETTFWFNVKDEMITIWNPDGQPSGGEPRLRYPVSTDAFNEEWYFQMSTIHTHWEIFNMMLSTYLRLFICSLNDNSSNITSVNLCPFFIDLMYDHLHNGTDICYPDFSKIVASL